MPYMANDNQNQVLDEHTEVIDDEKALQNVHVKPNLKLLKVVNCKLIWYCTLSAEEK
jgi:hypothetical protein